VNLVYHGTMAERLGVDLVIRAVATLKERLPSLRLHLWGHGDDLPRFQDLAKELRVSDRVEFRPKGFPLKELPEHLHRMHIGVVGNRRTIAGDLMLPVKLLEYVSLGIPVVAPRLRTIERYFSDDMLAYYPPEDVGALAESIHQLSSQPQRRAAQAERAHSFLAEYGWQRQGGELAGFYRTLVEN
jgi:glycosyltransferase involved in cell wall biosynthesis